MAVAGDSAGGNMATALAILARQRGDVAFVRQSLYCPVTDAGQDTGSYREFADGPYLKAASSPKPGYAPRPSATTAPCMTS